jgi:hypothetical protein
MSYLICEECGKYYELNEGKSSFSYDKCECGGKLNYSTTLKESEKNYKPSNDQKITCSTCGVVNPENSVICSGCGRELITESKKSPDVSISILGVSVGFGFLIIAIVLSVLAIFGTNIPQKAEDIPQNFLIAFGILAMCVAIISGLISSYIGGSINFKNGVINGGLVGVILGIMVGITSGSLAFFGVIAIFGSLSVVGGIFGTLLKRKL